MLGAMGAGGCSGMVGVGDAMPEGWLRGEGSITFVRFGSGDEGSEGGSWVGAGVSADILRVCEGGIWKAQGGEGE